MRKFVSVSPNSTYYHIIFFGADYTITRWGKQGEANVFFSGNPAQEQAELTGWLEDYRAEFIVVSNTATKMYLEDELTSFCRIHPILTEEQLVLDFANCTDLNLSIFRAALKLWPGYQEGCCEIGNITNDDIFLNEINWRSAGWCVRLADWLSNLAFFLDKKFPCLEFGYGLDNRQDLGYITYQLR